MAALIEAVELDALVPLVPVTNDRDPSRLLRNGLAVVAYAAFEDFFANRTAEALGALDSTRLVFDQLPERLMEAATVGAVKAISFRMAFEGAGASRRGFVQSHAEFIQSTGTSAYRFSPLTFSPASPNLSIEDIDKALKSLLIEDPWTQLFALASRLGYGGAGLRERVKQMLVQRNEAAHAAGADISIVDLRQVPHDLLAVAVAFDAVFSCAIAKIMERGPSVDPNKKFINITSGISIIFLDRDKKCVREQVEGRPRATKVHPTAEVAMQNALPRASKAGALLVLRDEQRRPIDWRITKI